MHLGFTVGFDTPGQGAVSIPLVITGHGMHLGVTVGFNTPGQDTISIPLVITGCSMHLCVTVGFDTPGQGAIGIALVVTGCDMRLGVTVGFDTSGQGDVGSVTGRSTGLGDVWGVTSVFPWLSAADVSILLRSIGTLSLRAATCPFLPKVNQPPLIPPTATQNLKQPCNTVSKVIMRTRTLHSPT